MSETTGPDQWLRAAEAARRLGVTRWTVVRRAEEWGVRSRVWPGGERRYHAADVAVVWAKIEAGEYDAHDEEASSDD